MNPLALFQTFLEYAGKGAAGFNELLTVIGPAIVKLEPDLQAVITDLMKLASDAGAVIGSGAAQVAAAVSKGAPPTA